MAERDNVATRTREAPGSVLSRLRTIAGWMLVVVATAAAAGAVRAHRFERALPAVRDGAPLALGLDVGDDRPFEPFTLAVIAHVGGDHAVLARALDRASACGADLVVAAGLALPAPPSELTALADVLVRHPGTVLLAADDDRGQVPDVDERLVALLTPPDSWEIHTRGCVVVGEPGGVTVRAPGGAYEWTMPVAVPVRETARVELLRVQSPDVATRDTVEVARGASFDSVARYLALAALWPLAGSGAGLVGVLGGAFVVAFAGLRLARDPIKTMGTAATTPPAATNQRA